MSNCKEGEGLWYINPTVFETNLLENNKRYTVILLADGEVYARGYATVGKAIFDEDFQIDLEPDFSKAVIVVPEAVFSTRYIYNFDIIIRDDEKTLAVLTNVSTSRG